MYNTQFKVKYNDIEEELIYKLKNEHLKESDENYQYSNQDIIDICDKLYRDEILSVFDAEDFNDNKVDKGLIYVYDNMIKNEKFKDIINLYINKLMQNNDVSLEEQETLKQIILISLFSQQMFHITHKCICQQIDVGEIDEHLLCELQKKFFEIIESQIG